MNQNAVPSFQSTSKFSATYSKLFQGFPAEQPSSFYGTLFSLEVNRSLLQEKLQGIRKDALLGVLKVLCSYIYETQYTS
jgi:hypothetical protein